MELRLNIRLFAVVTCAFVLWANAAWAWPPTYGAEFEFTSRQMIKDEENPNGFTPNELAAHARFVQQVQENCKTLGCMTEKLPPKPEKFNPPEYKVTYPDGWWFVVSLDPGCVEIQTRPATLEELKARKEQMDRDIFGVAKKVGLFGSQNYGAGHFNIGATSAFGDSGDAFLRYFVDYENHPELALGVLGNDTANGPAMAFRKESERKALDRIIEDLKQGRLKTPKDVAQRIQREVYRTHPIFPDEPGWEPAWHYTGIGLKGLNDRRFPAIDLPIELRSIAAQRDMNDFILLAELAEGRMKFLSEKKDPITYLNTTNTDYEPRELVSAFYKYVVEAGLSWEHFKPLLSKAMQTVPPDSFVTGQGQWKDKKFSQALISYFDRARSSSWLRGKIIEAFARPDAATSPHAKAALRVLEKKIRATKDPAQAEFLKNLAQEIRSKGVIPGGRPRKTAPDLTELRVEPPLVEAQAQLPIQAPAQAAVPAQEPEPQGKVRCFLAKLRQAVGSE